MAPNSGTTKKAAAVKREKFKSRKQAAVARIAEAEYALHETRVKRAKERADMEAIREHVNAMNIRTRLPRLRVQEFDSSEAFLSSHAEYCAANKTSFAIRDSCSREKRNKDLNQTHEKDRYAAASRGLTFEAEIHEVPEQFTHGFIKYRCVHATYHGSKVPENERERYQAKTRFTGCMARITADTQRVCRGGAWHSVHNHVCSPEIFNSYVTTSEISDQVLLARASAQISVGGDSRVIRDELGAGLGVPYTARQFQNLKHKLLGGGEAWDNLEILLEEFLSVEGNRVYVIHDADDRIVGIILQTAIQREFHRHFGGCLLLDWTHNTNNVGLYLGTHSSWPCFVTCGCLPCFRMPHGHVSDWEGCSCSPVLDFLCLTQSVDMMRTVLEVFIEDSQAAADVVESFVIDKDYKEWKAVSTVFARASVVLCQFHVAKWFKSVVADTRYSISLADRPRVLKLVRQIMYADSKDDFITHKTRLLALLPVKTHEKFDAYMEKRWFSCQPMWANHERGKVFTAGNTTTNRLESHWNQLKALLGKNRRIDRCVEAVLHFLWESTRARWDLPVPSIRDPPARTYGRTYSAALNAELVPASWPYGVMHFADNFNPDNIRIRGSEPYRKCGCYGDCRHDTCFSARTSFYCEERSYPMKGLCGNGKTTNENVRLMRVRNTSIFTLQASQYIGAGVVLGECLGILSLVPGERKKRQENEGFRLHFHEDTGSWGTRRLCVDAYLGGSLVRFLNHSCTPSAKFFEVTNRGGPTIVATTVRAINCGEEITVDYGDDLWFECRRAPCTM